MQHQCFRSADQVSGDVSVIGDQQRANQPRIATQLGQWDKSTERDKLLHHGSGIDHSRGGALHLRICRQWLSILHPSALLLTSEDAEMSDVFWISRWLWSCATILKILNKLVQIQKNGLTIDFPDLSRLSCSNSAVSSASRRLVPQVTGPLTSVDFGRSNLSLSWVQYCSWLVADSHASHVRSTTPCTQVMCQSHA